MPTQPSIPPAARSPFGPGGEPKTFEDVSHRVRHAARRQERAATSDRPDAGPGGLHPLLKVAAALFAGYAVGTIVHGRPEPRRPLPPPRPRPPAPSQPATAFRTVRPAGEGRSNIRFR